MVKQIFLLLTAFKIFETICFKSIFPILFAVGRKRQSTEDGAKSQSSAAGAPKPRPFGNKV